MSSGKKLSFPVKDGAAPNLLLDVPTDFDESDYDMPTFNVTQMKLPTDELVNHHLEETFEVVGMTAKEVEELCGGEPFDLHRLVRMMKSICWDFDIEIDENTKSYANYFGAHMLYYVGPKTRTVKAKDNDKSWKFIFSYSMKSLEVIESKEDMKKRLVEQFSADDEFDQAGFDSYYKRAVKRAKAANDNNIKEFMYAIADGLINSKDLIQDEKDTLKKHVDAERLTLTLLQQFMKGQSINDVVLKKALIVSTYKNSDSVYKMHFNRTCLVLSVKQISILATMILCKINRIGGKYARLLSPLAGATFSKADIPMLADYLGKDEAVTGAMVNMSCQSGGHHSTESNSSIAIAAAFAATKGLKDDDPVKKSIRTKIIKQYYNRDKKLNLAETMFFMENANGGLPSGYSEKTFAELFKAAQDIDMMAKEREFAAGEKARDDEFTELSVRQRVDLRKNVIATYIK